VPGWYTRVSGYANWIESGICCLSGDPPEGCTTEDAFFDRQTICEEVLRAGVPPPPTPTPLVEEEPVSFVHSPVFVTPTEMAAPPQEPSPQVATDFTIPPFAAPPANVFCFSKTVEVQTRDKGVIPMSELRVGDYIRTRHSGVFERVYSFAHRDETKEATFLRLEPFGLELSMDHMVFVHKRGAIPASLVRVGDRLETVSTNTTEPKLITEIRTVVRRGVFSPFTPSGSIIVNGGVIASIYVSFQDSGVLRIGGIASLRYQWLAHSFQFPHRFWCHWLQQPDVVDNVTRLSLWIQRPHQVATWFLKQHVTLQTLLMLPFVIVMCLFFSIETLLCLVTDEPWKIYIFLAVLVGIGAKFLKARKYRVQSWVVR